jgi:hypothetical protein
MIFSHQEIDFITSTNENYSIYRVYNVDDALPYVRICDDCKDMATRINAYTNEYKRNLVTVHTDLRSAKLEISPQNGYFNFKPEILLLTPTAPLPL